MNGHREVTARQIAISAFAAAALTILTAAAVVAWLAPGIPFLSGDLESRAAYLEAHHRCWSWGWRVGMLAALSVANLFVALAGRWLGRSPHLSRLALILTAGALVTDLGGIALYLLVAPGQAGPSLSLVETLAGASSFFLAKGLYAAAGVLLILAGRHELPAWLSILSIPVWLSGAMLAAATRDGAPALQAVSLQALVISLVIWSLALGGWYWRLGGPGGVDGRPYAADPRD